MERYWGRHSNNYCIQTSLLMKNYFFFYAIFLAFSLVKICAYNLIINLKPLKKSVTNLFTMNCRFQMMKMTLTQMLILLHFFAGDMMQELNEWRKWKRRRQNFKKWRTSMYIWSFFRLSYALNQPIRLDLLLFS